jgi:hypothetical protein
MVPISELADMTIFYRNVTHLFIEHHLCRDVCTIICKLICKPFNCVFLHVKLCQRLSALINATN